MIINLIGFQICWFGLVYWGNSFTPVALVLLTLHLLLISKKPNEYMLVVSVAAIGCMIDHMLVINGVLKFPFTQYIPFWLIVLWTCFSATIAHSLQFLKSSIALQFFVGGLFAPLSYIAGFKFDAVIFPYSLMNTYFVLSIIWSLMMVTAFKLESLFIRDTKKDA